MNTYIIYCSGVQVGTEYATNEEEAIFTFWDENPGYNTWNLTAFKVDVP